MPDLSGWDIERIVLTEEQLLEDITVERLRNCDHQMGEAFFDQFDIINHIAFGGWCLHKYPESADFILNIMNSRFGEVQAFEENPSYCGKISEYANQDIEDSSENEYYLMFQDICDFINLGKAGKARINTVLKSLEAYHA